MVSISVGHQDVTCVVNDATVHLLRHAVVVAAVSGFHVIDGDTEPLGDDGHKGAVCVAQDENAIRPLVKEGPFAGPNDVGDLLAERIAVHTKEAIRTTHPELFEKNVAEPRVVVLAGVDEDMVGLLVQPRDDAGEADDLRSGSDKSQCLEPTHDGPPLLEPLSHCVRRVPRDVAVHGWRCRCLSSSCTYRSP